MRLIISSLLLLISNIVLAQKEFYLLVGTNTNGKSKGIYVYKFNSSTGDLEQVNTAQTSNPTFLDISPNQKFVYAVEEPSDSTKSTVIGNIAAFTFNKKDGSLSLINKQSSGGKHPAYVAVDKTGKWVATANYSSGQFTLLPVKKDGSLGAAIQTMQDTGSGPVKGRQDGPHAHSTTFSPDNKYIFVADLGIDKLMIYNFNDASGMLKPASSPFFKTGPGTGPRHFAFHPTKNFAYLIEELSGNVSAFKYKDGKLDEIQNISAHPAGYKGIIGSADIHVSPDGKFLYCSNRGESNTIAIYKIDQKTGLLTLVGHQSTMGETPRNFSIDPTGNFLLAANQQSDNIVVFKIDKSTGLLTDSGKRIDNIGSPVCLKWANKE